MKLSIYGAGMAGLLSSHMLRRFGPTIHEAQDQLPDNHGALLRFRSDAVSQVTGIPFRAVHVQKAIKSYDGPLHERATMKELNQYSVKVTGSLHSRSVLDLSPGVRWIAPPDFLATLARGHTIEYGSRLSPKTVGQWQAEGKDGYARISTIPMPALMTIVGWPVQPAFAFKTIWSLRRPIEHPPTDVYQTIYYPNGESYYRASITGNELIIETANDPGDTHTFALPQILHDFGISSASTGILKYEWKQQRYGKLLPIPDRERHEFMLAMTDQYNLYSVGRFATWRQILLDDVVNDVRKIDNWITQRSHYTRMLNR